MTVIWVDWRTYKDQASADKAAVRMAKAPKLDGSAATNNTTTTTPKTTTPTTSTNKSSNTQWSSTNYKDSDWYYSWTERNAATGGSEFGWSSKTSTQTSNQTSTSAQTPSSNYSTRPSDILIKWESEYDPNTWYYRASQTKQGWDTSGKQVWGQKTIYNSDQIRATWDKLPYEEQQKRLQASPWLKDELAKMWITIKPKPWTTGGTPTTPTTTGWDGWDYQDNSPERMKQIADNVNQFAQTDPYIFNNEDSFRKFFIDWKGRTPEQEAFLMDLYKNRKKYNELDNYTADNIWNMAVNGQIPDSYLTYLKNTNPDRYAAVMDAKARETDKIKDKASMDTISSMDWWADYTSQTSTVIEWLKSQWLLVDKDWNLIDDRTENYASEEEQWYLKQIADLNATNLDIDNTVKHTYDDLVKAYPWATKATLMAMAQDMNADLLREKENNLVELTRLQGYVWYMQSERQERDTIGQNAINQLQKQYGMYYSYSPEWMSQLAQAQYAATNVTLDQADNWTDTQKQMALQRVLDDYYAKYWDIIQRSEAQVINDVMAYAKNNGVSLSQALEENFLKYLRQKPEFKTLSSWWTLNADPYVVKVWDVAYRYNPETDEFELIWWWAAGTLWGWTTNWQLYWFTNYTPITTEEKETTLSTFMSEHPLNSDWWECGSFVNDYLQSLWYNRLYDDPIDKKKAVTNSDTASKWSIAVMDSKKYPQYWHTAIVTDVQWDKVKLLESNWNDDHKVHERRVNKSEILWYFDPSKEPTSAGTTNQNWKYWNKVNWNKDWYSNDLVNEYEAYLSDPTYENKTDLQYKLWQYWMTFEDFTQQAGNYARTWMKASQVSQAANALEAAINLYEYIEWNKASTGRFSDSKQWWLLDWVGWYIPKLWWDAYDAKSYYDTLMSRLTLDKLIETKKQWATYWAMSEWEWKLLWSAATSLDWNSTWDKFQKNLEDMIYTLTRTITEWWWTLPTNFSWSTASKDYYQWVKDWKYKSYQDDNTPWNYDNYWQKPTRLS